MRSYEINSRSDKFVQVSRLLRDKRLVQPYGIWSGIVLATICREKRHQNEGRKKINKRNCMVGFLECFSCVWLLCVVHGCTNFNEHSLMLYWRIQVWINCQRWITISDILSYFNGWSEKARLCASYFGCCCCCCSLVFFFLLLFVLFVSARMYLFMICAWRYCRM